MKRRKKIILAAGMLMGAAALTGCAAGTPSASSAPTSQTAQQQTAEPTPHTSPGMEAADEETPAPIRLRVEDRDVDIGALEEDGRALSAACGDRRSTGVEGGKRIHGGREPHAQEHFSDEGGQPHHRNMAGQRQHGKPDYMAEGRAACSCGYGIDDAS